MKLPKWGCADRKFSLLQATPVGPAQRYSTLHASPGGLKNRSFIGRPDVGSKNL